jgi:hypothetical protein
MGKNRSASGLTNVIQYDNNGNIAFVSGSTTLMQVSSSGAITTTGTISGGDAADALLLNGTGSLAFVTTASYNVASSSFSSRTTQVERTYATTGSNTFTGAQFASDTSNAISFTSTASLYSDGGLRVQGNSFVSGTAYFNNIVVYGTSSIQYITSSQVNVGTNIITVNTDTPAVRFGGLAVFDSGSTQLTGSILWDSEKNHWVYSNPSGSTYSGGMFISGPRSSALGSEQGTTSCMLLVGQGSDHLTSSMIYHDSTVTCIPGIITGGSDVILSAANPVIYGGTAVGGVSISNNTGASYIKIFGACHSTTPNTTAFINANSTVLTINASGRVGIGTATPCSVLHVYGSNPSLIIQNSATAAVGNTTNIIFRNLLSTGCIHFAGYIAGIQQSTSTNTGDLSFNTYNNGSIVEGMRITSTGATCFANTVTAANYNACGNFYARYGAGDRMAFIYSEDYYFGMTNPSNDVRALKITAQAIDGVSTIQFYTGNNCERVRITCGGNVGIGCSAPLNRLTVNGNIGMSNTYNWGVVNDNDANWGLKVCTSGGNYSTFISYAGDQGSDRRGGIYNQNGHWVAYGNCVGNFVITCTLNTGANITVGGGLTVGSTISAGGSISGTLLTTQTQRLVNSTGGFANMVQKIHGAAGTFSSLVICVNLAGAGGYGYIINSGGTGGGQFQSGGGYINGPGNFSHTAPVGSGFTVTCHTCAGTNDLIRFVSSGGVHPFVSIQMFGSLQQYLDDNSFYIAYS